jgi:hypothetical protein
MVQFCPPFWVITEEKLISLNPALPCEIEVEMIPPRGFEADGSYEDTFSEGTIPLEDEQFRRASSVAISMWSAGLLAYEPPF